MSHVPICLGAAEWRRNCGAHFFKNYYYYIVGDFWTINQPYEAPRCLWPRSSFAATSTIRGATPKEGADNLRLPGKGVSFFCVWNGVDCCNTSCVCTRTKNTLVWKIFSSWKPRELMCVLVYMAYIYVLYMYIVICVQLWASCEFAGYGSASKLAPKIQSK